MAERFENVEAVLDFAIANEIEANLFYRDLAAKATVLHFVARRLRDVLAAVR